MPVSGYPQDETNRYKPLDGCLRILRILLTSGRPLTLYEIAEKVQRHPKTVWRMLKAIERNFPDELVIESRINKKKGEFFRYRFLRTKVTEKLQQALPPDE